MSNVVMLLQVEHMRFAKLLDLAQQQATNIALHLPVNHTLLEHAFAYLSSYPDQCHHPKENLVYRKLLHRHPEMAESLGDLVKEHEELGRATSDLMRAIGESERGPSLPNERLAHQLMEYLDLYRGHMLKEDQDFFPAALQRLSRDDFAEIDFALFDQPDPLLDTESEERFAELREEIMRLGAAEKRSGDDREEAALLVGLQSIAAFNDAMRQSGEQVLLIRSSGEGYELEHNGDVLVHIPACSESRAAWCAYFFWKAAASGERTS